LTIIAAIEDPTAMAKTLTYLGLPISTAPRYLGGHSIDSQWPDPKPIPDSIRFSP
jgi:hypothetical protein